MKIPDADLQVEALRDPKYNYGGQVVGVPNNQIKVTHIPSGITAICGDMRSQHKNRTVAIEMVEWGVSAAGYKYDSPNKEQK